MRALRTPFMEATDGMVEQFRDCALEELKPLAALVRREAPWERPVQDCQTVEGRIVRALGTIAVDNEGLLRARPYREMGAVDALFFMAALLDCAHSLFLGATQFRGALHGGELTVVRGLNPHEEVAFWLSSDVWDRWERELK